MSVGSPTLCHVELSAANDFVAAHHRHHKPVRGHRFSLGVQRDLLGLCGVAIVGRPVAAAADFNSVCEVLRLCTLGLPNDCSFLYGAAARAVKALGYLRIQTFILVSEGGGSLVASGWTRGHTTAGGSWSRAGRERVDDHPTEPKVLWFKDFV